ncbi:hypothetical protein PT2222_140087 [Paraburkholderia tropica]
MFKMLLLTFFLEKQSELLKNKLQYLSKLKYEDFLGGYKFG